MDNFPAEPTSQQIPSQYEELPKKKSLRRFFNVISWIIFFALLPVTVLIFLSQNTIPGDLFYPVKRSLENVVLAAASVSPVTRAAFRTDLTTTRFDEAEKLLLASARVNGLKDFVAEIQAAQNEVSAISNPVKKQNLQQKIQKSVIEYEKRLEAVRTELVSREQAIPLPTNTPAVIPTNTSVFLPTSTPAQPIPSKPPAATITTTPTSSINVPTQTKIQITNTPTQTQIPTPTLTPIPSFTPIPTSTPVPAPTDEQKTIETVDKVQDFLRCLKGTPAPHKECAPPEINSFRLNSENQQEAQEEEKSELEEKPEKIKEEKENKNEEDTQKPEKIDESEELDAEISNP